MPGFEDAAGIAVITSGIVAYVRHKFPDLIDGLDGLALVWVLAPLLALVGHASGFTPTEDVQAALRLGFTAAVVANGGYSAARTITRRVRPARGPRSGAR
jgi:hypothetical protein